MFNQRICYTFCNKFVCKEFYNEFRGIQRLISMSADDLEKIKKLKEKRSQKIDPVQKTYKMMKEELAMYRKGHFSLPPEKIPRSTDIAIIGGGIIGSSIAYALKQRCPESFNLMVVERDPKYTRSSSALSVGGIRQQFSLPENIQLSMYSAEFLRNIKQHLSVLDDDPPDIQFQPHGYLFLATENGVETMIENYKIQREFNAKVELLRPNQLKQKFPWLNVDGIQLASYGIENEGWFDPWALLSAFKKKSASLGTQYVNGEVIGFEFENHSIVRGEDAEPMWRANFMYIKDERGEIHCVEFGILVVAAGPYSGEIAKMLKMGSGKGLLSRPIPVEPRKRYVYVLNCENGPGIDMPLTIDPTGTYVRREGLGGKYICGRSPTESEEPDISNLDVDYNFFENSVWPILSSRIPCFESIKVSSAWAGYYDYNTLDQNALFGRHPYYPNIYFATGFGGHGIQMAPAIGRAMMELLIEGHFKTIDMSRFSLIRLYEDKPLVEKCIV